MLALTWLVLHMDMSSKPKYELDRWIQFHDVLVGLIYGHETLPNKTPVRSDAIIAFDPHSWKVDCLDARYVLKTPGTYSEYDNLIKNTPDWSEGVEKPIDTTHMLLPNGV